MECRRCKSQDRVEVCLFCGHAFCLDHRGERGGVPACVPCLEAEAARARTPAPAARSRGGEPDRAAAPATPVAAAPVAAASAARPERLPEPKGWRPLLWGLVAGASTAAYLTWFVGWLSARHPVPDGLGTVVVAGGALFAFAGVWAIVKSR